MNGELPELEAHTYNYIHIDIDTIPYPRSSPPVQFGDSINLRVYLRWIGTALSP